MVSFKNESLLVNELFKKFNGGLWLEDSFRQYSLKQIMDISSKVQPFFPIAYDLDGTVLALNNE